MPEDIFRIKCAIYTLLRPNRLITPHDKVQLPDLKRDLYESDSLQLKKDKTKQRNALHGVNIGPAWLKGLRLAIGPRAPDQNLVK